MADSVKIQIDLATNPAAAQRLEAAFKSLGDAGRRAGRDTTSGFDGAAARMDAFGKKLGGLKTLFATAFAGVGVGALFKGVIDASSESETALAQLDAAIKSTGNVAGLSRQQYIELANALAQTSTYSDETILSAETLLQTFARVRGNEFVGATKAVLDMSAALGRDLASSASLLGKALNDPVRGLRTLREVGVSFSADQEHVIEQFTRSGDVAKAQQIILAELARLYGGRAAAAADTLGGAIANLKKQFGELLESNSLSGATRAVQELTATLNDPNVKQGFATLVQGMAQVVQWSAQAASSIANVTKYFGEMTARMLGHVSADDPAGIEQQIVYLQKIVDSPSPFNLNRGYRAQAQAEIVRLKKLAADYQRVFVDGFVKPKPLDGANPMLAPTGKMAPPSSAGAGASAVNAAIKRANELQAAWAALSERYTALTAQVAGPGAQAWAKYADTVAKAAQAGGAVIAKGGNVAQVQALVQQIMAKAAVARDAELAKAAQEQAKAQQDVLQWIQQTRAELQGPTAVAVQAYLDKVAELRKLLDAGSITQDVFSVGVQTARDRLLKATQSTTDQVAEFWKQAARNSQDALAQFLFDPFQDGLRGMVRGVADAIRKIAAQMLSANIFKALGSYGQSQGGTLGAALSLFGSAQAFGGVWQQGQRIGFAGGGLVLRPTLFPMAGGRTGLMGEAGPEAIMPLVRASTGHLGVRAVGGGGQLSVRNINVVDPKAIQDAMTNAGGERVVLNIIKANATGIRQLLS